jgi:hypothetical protein
MVDPASIQLPSLRCDDVLDFKRDFRRMKRRAADAVEIASRYYTGALTVWDRFQYGGMPGTMRQLARAINWSTGILMEAAELNGLDSSSIFKSAFLRDEIESRVVAGTIDHDLVWSIGWPVVALHQNLNLSPEDRRVHLDAAANLSRLYIRLNFNRDFAHRTSYSPLPSGDNAKPDARPKRRVLLEIDPDTEEAVVFRKRIPGPAPGSVKEKLLDVLDSPEPAFWPAETSQVRDSGAGDSATRHTTEAADRPDDLLLQQQLHAMMDETAKRVMSLVQRPDLNADMKLRELFELDPRYAGFPSPRLAEILGVSDAYIRQTGTWKKFRRAAQNEGT